MEDASEKKRFKAIIIEIRAGAGGDEAALFAAELLRMYSNYASSQGWKKKILDSNPTALGGIKQVIFELESDSAWEQLKYEGGVHRVQRIPKTEKGGRIHTSTATVAVLPKPEKTEIKIKPEDLRVDYYRSSGPGGQYVNKRETAVRILHIPTGLIVTSQTERNLIENKGNAMSILAARLLERNSQQAQTKISQERNLQIGSADRSEKIRTYNFPQDRITDHRIKKSWHNIEKIIDGRLEPIIKTFKKKSNQ